MTKNNLLFTIYELIYWINLNSSKIKNENIKFVSKYIVLDLFDKIIPYFRNKKYWYTLNIKFFGLWAFRRIFKYFIIYLLKRTISLKIVSILYYSTIMHNGCFAKKKVRKKRKKR